MIPRPSMDVQDIPRLMSNHRWMLVTGALLGSLLFAGGSFLFPQRYRSYFILTIYSKYFQSPLIGDFLPSLSESSDSRAQRESLIRQVFTPDYLDSIGYQYAIYRSSDSVPGATPSPVRRLRTAVKNEMSAYGLYQPPSAEFRLASERQQLLDRIDIFSLNSTTFNIGFSYTDPTISLQVSKDLYGHVIRSLLDVRKHTLVTVRDAIEKRLQALAQRESTAKEAIPASQSSVAQELKVVREQLRAFSATYTEEHPLVQQLKEKESALIQTLGALPAANSSDGSLAGADSETRLQDLSGDLSKKLNYLDIAIDYDQQHQADYFATLESPMYPIHPSGPSKAMIVIGGCVFGFLCALFIAAIREYFDRCSLRAAAVADALGVPVLGEFPVMPLSVAIDPGVSIGGEVVSSR